MKQMGVSIERLDKRLQEHIRLLRQNEVSLGPSDVLELDSAKSRADRLVEVLRAKQVWVNNYEELMLLESTDHALKYSKLVALQQSFNVLHKYYANSEKEIEFERMKDEFLSWFSSATVAAIDSEDVKQLQSLKEKYASLNRNSTFEQAFGSYARNKVKGQLEEGSRASVADVLRQVFDVWKRCTKLADLLSNDEGPELVAQCLHEGITAKWDMMLKRTAHEIASAENPIHAARGMARERKGFLATVESEGSEHIMSVVTRIYDSIFSTLSEGYAKEVTSHLLAVINKITPVCCLLLSCVIYLFR